MRKNKIKVLCEYCENELYRIPSRIKKHKHQFCNRDCQNKWQSQYRRGINASKYNGGEVKKICLHCGKEYCVTPARYNKAKYCTHKCYWEANHLKNTTKIQCDCCKKEYREANSKLTRIKYSRY